MSKIIKAPDLAFKIHAVSLAINGNLRLSALASKLQLPLAELWRWRRDLSHRVALRPLTLQEVDNALAQLSGPRMTDERRLSKDLKVIVYSVVIGPISCLSRFEPEQGVHYVLFTDDLSTPAPDYWKKIHLSNPERLPQRRLSRRPKIQPHLFLEPHDISVFVAPTIMLRRPLRDFVLSRVAQHPIAVHHDAKGGCVYEAGDDCSKWAVDDRQQLIDQLERYRNEGMADGSGLVDDDFIVRRDTDKIRCLNDCWWNEYINGSEREQLSLAYVLWKQGVSTEFIAQSAPEFLVWSASTLSLQPGTAPYATKISWGPPE